MKWTVESHENYVLLRVRGSAGEPLFEAEVDVTADHAVIRLNDLWLEHQHTKGKLLLSHQTLWEGELPT